MITISLRLKELMDAYEQKPTDELAHEIIRYLKASMAADKPRTEIVLQFLTDHCYSLTGPCDAYVTNVPGNNSCTFYIGPDIVEQIEVISAANKIRNFINKNFVK